MSINNRMAIVLAAGKGTRMKSDLPKVLCQAAGRPLVQYVLDALREAGVSRILAVVGYRSDLVRAALAGQPDLEFVEQTEQLGTGHAVLMCRQQLAAHQGPVFIVTGDSPLTQASSIRALFEQYDASQSACVLGTLEKDDPTGLGRIVRDDEGRFLSIVEEKDATEREKQIKEVNMSSYVFDAAELVAALDQLKNDNRQQEYYLTDCPGILQAHGKDVRALPILLPCEALSVNTVEDLAVVEAELRKMGH
jgi:bifunctional UDP-N-acetylglucosamine pyrophosphorylase/glucosamine-1-phosphate N-acetyltransferase/UDP-N-acetylglucosamine pyrophosphorylase